MNSIQRHGGKTDEYGRQAGSRDVVLADVTAADKASICRAIEAKVKPQLEQGGQWMLDTSLLRIAAIKEPV